MANMTLPLNGYAVSKSYRAIGYPLSPLPVPLPNSRKIGQRTADF